MTIKALANIHDTSILCIGEIEICWINELQAYVTWRLFDDKKLIASKSESYFFRKDIDTIDSLLNQVIRKIENYRIGRKRIFEKVEIKVKKESSVYEGPK